MKTYSNITELKSESNGHFFDRSSMRFFNSRILSTVYRGVYFITSEQHRPEDARLFTVRMSLNGSIETVGQFQQFKSTASARAFIRELPEYLPQAYELASEEFNGKPIRGAGFVSAALTEPTNRIETFCGACTWLIKNHELCGFHFIKFFEEKYNERLNEVTA